ncbi:ATP-dependent DNA helicase [Plasmodium gonderi]|uniref:DNA 3'-5' helicase n=1 Tax=Plasmodium gonderi TaxID=77519 RepID=A0A1Y1JK91_PLAGO|nr:ATP-dependent DNA helicase [Plasmodium gonderi]GAW82936.1 ATP-dependent DNA helicase [Plasmodium gonderi]
MLKFVEVKKSSGSETDQSEKREDEEITYTLEDLKKRMEMTQKKHFGYKNLKDFQVEAVHAVFQKMDSLIIMATGMGKSLCYQIPSLMTEAKNKFTFVISPLISLMKDQVDNLNRKKISSVFLGSGQKISNEKIVTEIKHGGYKIVYCSPEYALNNKQLFLILKRNILLIAIDEVHCMSEWGHDFRPSYRKLNELRHVLKEIPFMCLTATCTKNVQSDILKNLKYNMNKCLIKTSSVNKRNLFYCVREKTNIFDDLKDVLDIPISRSVGRTKHFIDNSKICPYNSTLIYVNSKKECENVFIFLKERGLLVRMYHADLSNEEKKEAHEKFLKDEVQIIVATVAFGMGIDKPDIRRIIHYGFSRSLEAYVQQVGRAGRDNSNAEAILFFHINDESKIKNLLIRENIANNLIETNFQRVEHIVSMFTEASDYAYSTICRRKKIYEYFDENPTVCEDLDIFNIQENCGICFYVKKHHLYLCASCDNCVYYLETFKRKNRKKSLITTAKKQPWEDHISVFKNSISNDGVLNSDVISENSKESVEQTIDLTKELKILLNCIVSLKGRTGISVICKILVKSKEASIIKKGYHNIKEYGEGMHKPTNWWSALMKIARNDKFIKETLNYSKDVSYISVGITSKGEEFIKSVDQKYAVRLPFFLIDKPKKGLSSGSNKGDKKTKGRRNKKEHIGNSYGENSKYGEISSEVSRMGWSSRMGEEMDSFREDFHQNRSVYDSGNNEHGVEYKLREGVSTMNDTNQSTVTSHHGMKDNNLISEGKYKIREGNTERINGVPKNKYEYFNMDKRKCIREYEYKEEKLTDEKINDSIMKILLRTRILEARKQNIPPFQLISDKPLKDICHKRLTSVHLIRKHVDNISPICPNAFLEKLISGVRGFCLLHDLDTNININNTDSQHMIPPKKNEKQEPSSLNRFTNLISSLSYNNSDIVRCEDHTNPQSHDWAVGREYSAPLNGATPYPHAGGDRGSTHHHNVIGTSHTGTSHTGSASLVRSRLFNNSNWNRGGSRGSYGRDAENDERVGKTQGNYQRREEPTMCHKDESGNGPWNHFHGDNQNGCNQTGESKGGTERIADPIDKEKANYIHKNLMEQGTNQVIIMKKNPLCNITNSDNNQLENFSGKDRTRLMKFIDDDFKFINEVHNLEANQNSLLVEHKKSRDFSIDLSDFTYKDGKCGKDNVLPPAHGREQEHLFRRNENKTTEQIRTNSITHLKTPKNDNSYVDAKIPTSENHNMNNNLVINWNDNYMHTYTNEHVDTSTTIRMNVPNDAFINNVDANRTMADVENQVNILKEKKKKLDLIDSFSYNYKKNQDENNFSLFPNGHAVPLPFQDLKRRKF